MKELNRQKVGNETEKQQKARIAMFYKEERAALKEESDLRLYSKPKDLAELIHKLHCLKQATYYIESGRKHCDSGRARSENDLYLCLRHYHNKNVKFKFGSELLYNMMQDSILSTHFCYTINRHCYGPKNLTASSEDRIRKYLDEKKLNIIFE